VFINDANNNDSIIVEDVINEQIELFELWAVKEDGFNDRKISDDIFPSSIDIDYKTKIITINF